jgi:hypothetical protein
MQTVPFLLLCGVYRISHFYCYAESMIMLRVIMRNVIMLNVAAPKDLGQSISYGDIIALLRCVFTSDYPLHNVAVAVKCDLKRQENF